MRAVRHDGDDAEKDGENRSEHADFLAERVAAFDFRVNFKFSHKGESILTTCSPAMTSSLSTRNGCGARWSSRVKPKKRARSPSGASLSWKTKSLARRAIRR